VPLAPPEKGALVLKRGFHRPPWPRSWRPSTSFYLDAISKT
jgi:hypothetical protein